MATLKCRTHYKPTYTSYYGTTLTFGEVHALVLPVLLVADLTLDLLLGPGGQLPHTEPVVLRVRPRVRRGLVVRRRWVHQLVCYSVVT